MSGRQELSIEYLLANFGVDTARTGLSKFAKNQTKVRNTSQKNAGRGAAGGSAGARGGGGPRGVRRASRDADARRPRVRRCGFSNSELEVQNGFSNF